MSVVIVVNPQAAAGRTGRRLEELERLASSVFGEVDVRATRAPGHGSDLAQQAAEEGAELVIAVGGDGTANEVVAGLVRHDGATPAFALVPAGTGSDLVRTLGMPKSWDAALAAIQAAEPRATDVLEGTFTQADGTVATRHGINVVGIGMAGDVVGRANRSSKRLGGRLTFLGATVSALLAWRPPRVVLTWEDADGGEGRWEGPLVNAFLANGRYCGGGMCVAPTASMHDGVLEGAIIPSTSTLTLIRQTPRLYDGTLAEAPDVVTFRCRSIRAEAPDGVGVPCDIDGEQPGGLPVRLACVPGRLRVRAPWASPPFG